MLERQIIELNEDLQTLENEKNELNEQIDDLKEQLQYKDRQIQTFEVSQYDYLSRILSFFDII
jgi:chromosome segregation ATPase